MTVDQLRLTLDEQLAQPMTVQQMAAALNASYVTPLDVPLGYRLDIEDDVPWLVERRGPFWAAVRYLVNRKDQR